MRKTIYKKIIAVLLFAFIFNIQGKTQSYWENIDYYTTRNGLPNNIILSLYQDKKGFLWVGTLDGLCRYDGKEFKLFNTSFLATKEIWRNSISVITEDNENNLWVGTRTGVVATLNSKTGKWKWFRINNDFITDIYIDADNTKWISTKLEKLGKVVNDSFEMLSKVYLGVNKIISYPQNKLLLVGGDVNTIDKKTGFLQLVERPTTPTQPSMYYEGVASNGKHLFYFLNNKSIESHSINGKEKHTFDFEFNFFENKPGILDNGNLLLLNANNLAEITPSGEIVYKINLNETSSTLKGNTVNAIIEDNSGLIWIGTNSGLFKVDRNKTQFKKLTSNTYDNPLKYNYIRSLYTQDDYLWVGTKEGQIGQLTFDYKTGELKTQQWYPTHLPTGKPDYTYTINTMLMDPQGNMWAGGSEELYLKKKNVNIFNKIKPTENGTHCLLDVVWSICQADSNHILIGTATQGMVLMDTRTQTATQCTYNGDKIRFSVWNIYKDTRGEIWAGTSTGLYKLSYNKKQRTYTLYNKFIQGSAHLWQGNIWSIVEDKNHVFWFGTTETGITMYNPQTGASKQYTEYNGLVSNVTSSIVVDDTGNLWISTVNGLSKFDTKNSSFTNFREEDGLLNNDFNFKAGVIAKWKQVYMGTKIGITSFNPQIVSYTLTENVPVEITGIKIKGNEINYQPDSIIILPHNQNDITLRFAILDYRKEFHHSYRYKLEGYQTEWQDASFDNPLAVYTNLPPGKYTFVVIASANGTVWNKKNTSISFIITPALWQRPYFWITLIALLAIAIFIIIRNRINSIIKYERENARIQKAMAELEMKALRAQMNPHFIFNAIGAIQHFVLKKDTLQANEYLAKFAKLMRVFLESSRNNYTTLASEVDMLDLYLSLEKLRFEEKFDYNITLEKGIDVDEINIPSMLLQPFVENAINHGLMHKKDKGHLKISFTLATKNMLVCVIEDDGVGREKAGQIRRAREPMHISRGNDIVQERVKTFLESEDIAISIDIIDKFDSNGLASGTIVRVKIPLK